MPDTNDDPKEGYIVQERDGQFEVRTTAGRVVMVCVDKRSASHYASLLNEAFRGGFKMGYREGRERSK